MSIGILLTNLGTPDFPTRASVRTYLKEFLSDSRVIELPRLLWLPILYGIILPFRSYRSAKLYQKIWSPEGSALRINLEKQTQKLQQYFKNNPDIIVLSGMRYGNPSLDKAMAEIKQKKVTKLLLLPLYPQYSAATTATTFDKIAGILKTWRHQPELRMVSHYYNHPGYISAVAKSIENFWQTHPKPQKLVFSFHGLPQKFVDQGDPYQEQCKTTAHLIAEKLNLSAQEWLLSFQSRLGKTPWLQPYTDQVLKTISQTKDQYHQPIKHVAVVCPGFSADCLETLEEINDQNRRIFMESGGERFYYIPCLNDIDIHIDFLSSLIQQHIQGWQQDKEEK